MATLKEQVDSLTADLAAKNQRIAELTQMLELAGTAVKVDERVRVKMAAGLSRAQAEQVLANQDREDALAAAAQAK